MRPDPLLRDLCNDTDKNDIFFNKIIPKSSKSMFSAALGFPLLDERLLVSQQYSMNRNLMT
jgi:hypothetical protein